MKKIISVMMFFIMTFLLFASSVFAFSHSAVEWGEGAPPANSTQSDGGAGTFELGTDVKPTAPGNAGATVATVIGVIQWVGYAIAIGMLVYIGIKYVMASVNEKADMKNSLIKYVIGAALIIGAVTIADIIFSVKI